MDQDKINEILSELESGYDRMAGKFSDTRKFFWRDVEFISQYIEDGDSVLDFGSGNGRLLEILKDKNVAYTGADISQGLIDVAKSRYPGRNFLKISSLNILPFPDENFNKIVSVAVFHHFPPVYAKKITKELFRTTKSGGKIIITAWNLWQGRFWKKFLNPLRFFQGMGLKDIYIPFKNNKGEVFDRYHHAYTKEELKNIFTSAGFEVDECYLIKGKNIIIMARK